MGRKKKNNDVVQEQEEEAPPPSSSRRRSRDDDDSDDSSSEYVRERKHYDIDPEIQELAYAFNIDEGLTQKLNDIMIEDRRKTWEQDLARLHEILKDAHTPAAMLNLKLKDMEKGTFVGKAKCGPKVKEMCQRHRLDKGASTKLEEAMSMREAMGKDVEKDLALLDEHLMASNAPSKLVSMKLESLRKGFNIGHCIYSREPAMGNQGPGVDGVFDKKEKRALGYTDADLAKRFSEQAGVGTGQLMDEATIRKLMRAEREQHDRNDSKEKKERGRGSPKRKRSRSGSRANGTKRKRSRSRSGNRSSSPKRKKQRSRSRSRRCGASQKKRKSKSRSAKRKKSASASPARKKSRSPSGKNQKKKKEAVREKKSKSRSRKRARSSSSERDKGKKKDAKSKK